MKVNYVLMYGIPYVRYKEFEKFEDISKFLVHKGFVNYSIFKKLEDKEEIEMIYRDNDIHYLENFVKEQDKEIERLNNIINELEKALKDNIDMCDGFIDTATSDLQELGARQNGKTYYQTILLENTIALKIYQKELDKLQELKGSDKE